MKPSHADLVMQAAMPVVPVPRFGSYERLAVPGARFLVADDGMWLEVHRRWCHLVLPCATGLRVPNAFGRMERVMESAAQHVPAHLLQAFVDQAILHHPVEVGGLIVRRASTGEMRLHMTETIKAGIGSLRQRWPDLCDDEDVVIDLHSHGPLAPVFSRTDIEDTGAEVVIAGVVGGLGGRSPALVLEFFAHCQRVPLAVMAIGADGRLMADAGQAAHG